MDFAVFQQKNTLVYLRKSPDDFIHLHMATPLVNFRRFQEIWLGGPGSSGKDFPAQETMDMMDMTPTLAQNQGSQMAGKFLFPGYFSLILDVLCIVLKTVSSTTTPPLPFLADHALLELSSLTRTLHVNLFVWTSFPISTSSGLTAPVCWLCGYA